jgi:hypothetical protein
VEGRLRGKTRGDPESCLNVCAVDIAAARIYFRIYFPKFSERVSYRSKNGPARKHDNG